MIHSNQIPPNVTPCNIHVTEMPLFEDMCIVLLSVLLKKNFFQERHSGTSLDKMSTSTHSTSSTGEDSAGLLGMPHGKITKALSMSSIPAATNADKSRGEDLHTFKTISSWGCQKGLWFYLWLHHTKTCIEMVTVEPLAVNKKH